jgi:hypothetical protein
VTPSPWNRPPRPTAPVGSVAAAAAAAAARSSIWLKSLPVTSLHFTPLSLYSPQKPPRPPQKKVSLDLSEEY